MLGELYQPKGKALETAQTVLECKEVYACNVAWGCSNRCTYCYGRFRTCEIMRLPSTRPVVLVFNQLLEMVTKPKGVFLSFHTDPFLSKNLYNTSILIQELIRWKIPIATLSKMGSSSCGIIHDIRTGMTIVSDNEAFREKYEPRATPIDFRISQLRDLHKLGAYTWISLEPYPTPAIWKQDLKTLLDKINFVDFIIMGKWNYDKRANDPAFYKRAVEEFVDYCKSHGIRHHVKSDTIKFIESSKFSRELERRRQMPWNVN